jgi:hypothetical protein
LFDFFPDIFLITKKDFLKKKSTNGLSAGAPPPAAAAAGIARWIASLFLVFVVCPRASFDLFEFSF